MWFKVDDKLHDHRKARKAGKAAMGVWVLAGSWSMDNETDGFIPDDVLTRWGSHTDARSLVAVGLWEREEFQGESGYRFHDWSRFQPSAAVTAARRAKESEAAQRGNHNRWHVQRGISDPDCELCYQVPDQPPDEVPDRVSVRSVSGQDESAPNRPVPVPDPEPHVSPDGETITGRSLAVDMDRPDVDRLCDHLADRIAEDGSKRPAIGKGWRNAARLMLDKDNRTEAEIHAAIDWCQNHHFWRAQILSMPTLREKFDRLRKVAQSEQQRPPTSRNDEFRAMQERQMARAIEREREMGLRP